MSTEEFPNVIMVCGVAGVGKTSLIRRLVAKHPAVMTRSAGAIIAEAREITDPELLRTLPANELERSQELLVAGFERIVRTISARVLLLDGHAVIDGNEGLYSIPIEVFSRLSLNRLIHVEERSSAIYERRRLDTHRVRPERSVLELDEYQCLSAERAHAIAVALSIPLAVVESGDDALFEALVLQV